LPGRGLLEKAAEATPKRERHEAENWFPNFQFEIVQSSNRQPKRRRDAGGFPTRRYGLSLRFRRPRRR